jgi:RNA polymerase sigma-70 factor (ECF subfamily)
MKNRNDRDCQVRELAPLVKAIVNGWARTLEDVDDISQEVMLKILKTAALPKVVSKSWLNVVAKNTACDYYRRQLREEALCYRVGGNWQLFSNESASYAVAETSDPFLVKNISDAIRDLPKESSCTFLLHVAGYGYADIARVTQAKLGTVRSRLHYARRYLKIALAPGL